MMTNLNRIRPKITVLSQQQLDHIHNQSLQILSTVGSDVDSEKARNLLVDAGAQADGSRVCIPGDLVQWALDTAPSADGEWFDYLIRVEGQKITISVDGKVINTYTEPTDLQPKERFKERRLSNGTFAIQGHDPKSITYYREIKVRTL